MWAKISVKPLLFDPNIHIFILKCHLNQLIIRHTYRSKAVLLLWIIFVIYASFCHAFLSVQCSHVVTCWKKADLLALLYVMFYFVFVTFLCGVLERFLISASFFTLLSTGLTPRNHCKINLHIEITKTLFKVALHNNKGQTGIDVPRPLSNDLYHYISKVDRSLKRFV